MKRIVGLFLAHSTEAGMQLPSQKERELSRQTTLPTA